MRVWSPGTATSRVTCGYVKVFMVLNFLFVSREGRNNGSLCYGIGIYVGLRF